MKKQRKRQTGKPKSGPSIPPQTKPKTRREMLAMMRNGAIFTGVIVGSGYLLVNSMMATAAEQDLTRVGNGKPAIVQVHDAECALCRSLQRETRAALKEFDAGRYEYVVANIKAQDGAAFAQQFGVPHVTLMLFDRRGTLVNVLTGTRDRAELAGHFRTHFQRYGAA